MIDNLAVSNGIQISYNFIHRRDLTNESINMKSTISILSKAGFKKDKVVNQYSLIYSGSKYTAVLSKSGEIYWTQYAKNGFGRSIHSQVFKSETELTKKLKNLQLTTESKSLEQRISILEKRIGLKESNQSRNTRIKESSEDQVELTCSVRVALEVGEIIRDRNYKGQGIKINQTSSNSWEFSCPSGRFECDEIQDMIQEDLESADIDTDEFEFN